MKLLRNPIVVGLLAVAAVAVVIINAVLPMMRRGARRSSVSPAVATATPVPVEPAKAPVKKTLPEAAETPAPKPMPASPIDLASVQLKSIRWTEAPRRDPFQIRELPTVVTNRPYPPAMEVLKLSAIWRQTGGSLAVINHKLLVEGDTILGFTIQSIAPDAVGVSGPNGREMVDFQSTVTPMVKTKESISAASQFSNPGR